MSVPVEYPDSLRFIKTTVDNYGSEVYDEEACVDAIFVQNTGWAHLANQDAVTADIIAFVDPCNVWVKQNYNRLEEMLVVAELFGVDLPDAFYKVTAVTVFRDHLFDNQIDNIQLALQKTVGIQGVS